MSAGTDIRRDNEDAARRLLNLIGERATKHAARESRKSYVGHVMDATGPDTPVIRIMGQDYLRSSYRLAKGVQVKGLQVGDEVLMTQTASGVFVLTQVIRYEGDDSDDMVIDGSITATTITADFVTTESLTVTTNAIVPNMTVTGNLTAQNNGNFGGNVTIDGDLDVPTGQATFGKLTVGELKVNTKVGFFGTTPILARPDYTVTNKTVQRTLNANSETLDAVLDVLGTLISDLQDYGLLKGTHN